MDKLCFGTLVEHVPLASVNFSVDLIKDFLSTVTNAVDDWWLYQNAGRLHLLRLPIIIIIIIATVIIIIRPYYMEQYKICIFHSIVRNDIFWDENKNKYRLIMSYFQLPKIYNMHVCYYV